MFIRYFKVTGRLFSPRDFPDRFVFELIEATVRRRTT